MYVHMHAHMHANYADELGSIPRILACCTSQQARPAAFTMATPFKTRATRMPTIAPTPTTWLHNKPWTSYHRPSPRGQAERDAIAPLWPAPPDEHHIETRTHGPSVPAVYRQQAAWATFDMERLTCRASGKVHTVVPTSGGQHFLVATR